MSNALLYIVTVLIWGSTFFAIEFQLGTVAPEVSLVYRFLGAAALLFAWSRARGLRIRFPVCAHARFLLLGVLLFGANYIIAYRAQIYITSALAALSFSAMLWMNIANSRLFFGIRASRDTLLGAVLGGTGMLIVFIPLIENVTFDDSVMLGSLLSLTAALTASFGNMVSQAAQKSAFPVLQSNAWAMLYGSLFSAAVALVSGHAFSFDPSFSYVASLAYLTVFGSVVAFGAYLTLLGRIGAHKAGYVMVMFPIVALLLSAKYEGLTITPTILLGTVLALGGNVLILRRRNAEEDTAGRVQAKKFPLAIAKILTSVFEYAGLQARVTIPARRGCGVSVVRQRDADQRTCR